MRSEAQQWLERTLEAVLDRDGGDTGESTVVVSHLAQMKSFGIRQGVELYPAQDSNRTRYKYIEKLYDENRIDLSLVHYWDLFLASGKLCWYLRPTGNSYRIYHFGGDNFKANYSPDGDLEEVIIIYSYSARPAMNISGSSLGTDKRWIKLCITKDKIITEKTEIKPEFYSTYDTSYLTPGQSTGFYTGPKGVDRSESINTLGWIPCVITGNYVSATGTEGRGEFEMVAQQLYKHDQMCRAVAENISFFGNPTLVTSRTVSEVLETGEGPRSSYSSAAGFSGSTPSTSRSDPDERNAAYKKTRMAKVIGNVQADERFGYILPDPVSPDQSRYIAEYRESLHAMLGGVDPQSISAGATAFEIKSLYGRSAATALVKARSLYKHGLCKVFEMAIMAEEQLFKLSIAMALKLPAEQLSDQMVQDLISQPTLPKELKTWVPQGLPPLGDRRVMWRWLGPVFEDSPLDLQQKSIVVRNLEEVGVETSSALKFLFPEKTESEIRVMLTGFPFREANQSAMALSQQISSLGSLMTTPDPRTGQPIGMQVNNIPIIESILTHILKRLNYGIANEPASTPGSWSSTPGGSELSAGTAPAAVQPTSAAVLPPGQPIPGTYGATSSAAAAGLAVPAFASVNGYSPVGSTPVGTYGSGPIPDFATGLPVPGGTSRASATPGVPGLSTFGNVAQPIPGVPTDLQQYPGVLQSIWGNASGPVDQSNPNKSSGNRKPSPDNKRRAARK
jgi:hypothetical protein